MGLSTLKDVGMYEQEVWSNLMRGQLGNFFSSHI